MLILICARGSGACSPKKKDKNGAIWCIQSVPKYVIINLKINNFEDNKSATQILCHIFAAISHPDRTLVQKTNTVTFI